MTEHPLYIALVWHMHQPFYRDLRTGEISLPWVRLHAAKDYLHMAQVQADFPQIHTTINMVPALTEQMLAWAEGREADRLVYLAEQDDWTDAEKRTILNLAYSINWDNIIRRYARYAELLDRRPQALAEPDTFTAQDCRDLLAWFNLAWIDPNWLEQDGTLAALVAKGSHFTLADQRTIHARQREIAAAVLPLYRKLAQQGQLEISTTPYYHPILPLLVDTGSARRPSPDLPLPTLRFAAPADAAAQLQLAVEAHVRHFGAAPQGVWPSEGAVSPEIIPLITAAGFQWLATDEVILGRSLGQPFDRDPNNLITNPRALYQPYRVLAENELGPSIIFRDHELSDRIGFLYQKLPGAQAAEDLIYRLLEIRNRLDDRANPYLVSIILDGENCWEHYEHNGDVFLNALYRGLSQRDDIRTVTVSEYLTNIDRRPAGTLAKLATGSWIGGDLTTWIGDPEHSRAWETLARTRAHLLQIEHADPGHAGLSAAWHALYAAEGSDWFWWYSHRNSSDQDTLFDQLFRDDLAAVYEALNHAVPVTLDQPISQAPAGPNEQAAAGYCSPQLTGAPYPGAAWALAATLQPASASTGAMQRASGQIERLFIGHDERNLYLRLDLRDSLDQYEVALYLSAAPGAPVNQRIRARHSRPSQAISELALGWLIERQPGQPVPFLFRAAGHDQWQSVSPAPAATGKQVLEVSMPLNVLGLAPGKDLSLLVTLAQRGGVVTQLPERGMGTFTLEQFEAQAPHSQPSEADIPPATDDPPHANTPHT
ncbi:MAG: glycoside hydrolase [Chloroflexi bacterium HGW-Chloroflexi-1]|nr:MAG: glycoside hydrolase [Chloroflexi bacterium HGW-Chloroflexi-1]